MEDGSNRSSLRESIKRVRDFMSPPLTGWHSASDNGYEYRSHQPQEWHGPGPMPRARSPTAAEQEEATARQLRESQIAQEYNDNIDRMIQQVNGASGMALDVSNPNVRKAVSAAITAHGISAKSINLLRRSPILLSMLGDQVKKSRLANFACAAGSRSAACVRNAAGLMQSGFFNIKDRLLHAQRQRRIAQEQGSQRQYFPPYVLPQALQAFAGQAQAAPGSASAASRQQQQEEMDRLLQLQLSQVPYVPASAPPPPPPSASAQEPVNPDLVCPICFEDSTEGAVFTNCGHRFHRDCINTWLNGDPSKNLIASIYCPMCRQTARPLTTFAPAKRQRQTGGGSRKTRSKSKSKSKTRRLRKSRKPRKTRKPRSSSRRK